MLKPWIKLGWPANNSETRLITPGVSILWPFSYSQHVKSGRSYHSRLALEVLHNIKEPVVHIGLLRELDFNLVKVTESILFEMGISTGVPKKHLLITSVWMFGAAVISHIEDGLLPLVQAARSWVHRMSSRHASTERRHGGLSGTPAPLGLEWRPEDGRCITGCAHGSVRRHGAMRHRGEHLMLRRGSTILDAVGQLPVAGVSVDSTRRASRPRRCAEWYACWVCTVVGQQATRAVYCARESVCDRLVDWDGAGIAVVRRAGRVWISICALALTFPLFSFSFPFPLALAESLLLLETVPLLEPLLLLHIVGLVAAEAFRGEWTRGHSSRSIPQSDC